MHPLLKRCIIFSTSCKYCRKLYSKSGVASCFLRWQRLIMDVFDLSDFEFEELEDFGTKLVRSTGLSF